MEDFIQLKKDNIFRLEIRDCNGVPTGEHLEFDLEDIDLPLRLNKCEYEHKKNLEYVQSQFIIIDKKEDKKGKFLLSYKEEEKIKALKEFYQREMETLDLFLGKGGTKKLLCGRNPYWEMYDDIDKLLEPILPKINIRADKIIKNIKEKYSNKEKDVLE